jgi:hypothetical protein
VALREVVWRQVVLRSRAIELVNARTDGYYQAAARITNRLLQRGARMPARAIARILLAALVIAGLSGAAAAAAAAATPTAIFPFEIYDTSGEAPQPDLAPRLAMATRVLSEALEKTGRYSPVDLEPFSAEIAASAPRYRCGGCFLPIARRAGADLAVVGVVHKVSSLISSMDIWIFDAASGKDVAHLSGQIRGDTAEAYEHGVRFLVRNRLPDAPAADGAGPK